MCDGPPFMNKKINRLARGVKCGTLMASALSLSVDDSARLASAASSPASAKTLLNASAPNPPPMRVSTSRRESTPCLAAAPDIDFIATSIHVHKLIRPQQHLRVPLPTRKLLFGRARRLARHGRVVRAEERQTECNLALGRRACVESHKRAANPFFLAFAIRPQPL